MKKSLQKLATIIILSTISVLFLNFNQAFAKPTPAKPTPPAATEEQKKLVLDMAKKALTPEAIAKLRHDLVDTIVSGTDMAKAKEAQKQLEALTKYQADLAQEAKNAAAEEECQKNFKTSCAQHAEEIDPNSLTNGTFNVSNILTLDNGDQQKKYFTDKSGNSPLVSFIITIMDFAITIMGSIAVILFIAAGFMFMLASGDQQQVDKAKEVVKFAIYGLIIAALSYIIVIFVQSLFVAD